MPCDFEISRFKALFLFYQFLLFCCITIFMDEILAENVAKETSPAAVDKASLHTPSEYGLNRRDLNEQHQTVEKEALAHQPLTAAAAFNFCSVGDQGVSYEHLGIVVDASHHQSSAQSENRSTLHADKWALVPCHTLSEHFLSLECDDTPCLWTPSSLNPATVISSTQQQNLPRSGTNISLFTNSSNATFVALAAEISASLLASSQPPSLQPYRIRCWCRVLECIECVGPRRFIRNYPCKRYSGYYYVTALTYSIFLGLLAVDRFYLGYSAIAVGKLMTLGGFGMWWLLDIVLLITGNLGPSDGSEWQPWNSDDPDDYWPRMARPVVAQMAQKVIQATDDL